MIHTISIWETLHQYFKFFFSKWHNWHTICNQMLLSNLSPMVEKWRTYCFQFSLSLNIFAKEINNKMFSNDGQDHKDKILKTSSMILSQEMNIWNTVCCSNILFFRRYVQCQFFKRLAKCQNIKYQWKDVIIRNIHLKYQNSSTHCSKVFTKFKVLKK